MPLTTLERDNRAAFSELLSGDAWTVACLCAAWCNVCADYRSDFERLAARHPGVHFAWIDVEDNADVVGDIDIENFPTVLMQRGDVVAFYGTVLPDARVVERIFLAQQAKDVDELAAEVQRTPERRGWQSEVNLRRRLAESKNEE
ncbi:MAG TPA: thioredoxin family protein [Paucimonas sp.]|nr:thioredoxin family protein [Paucimonas sp.]